MKRLFSLFLILLVMPVTDSLSNENLEFAERFALAEDREKVIEDLIPGTAEFYFYSALLAQQKGDLDAAEALLEPWIKRHGRNGRVREIENRQALLRYSDDPAETLEYLKKQLGIRFHHEQQTLDTKPDFPTELDPTFVDWDAFLKNALKESDLSDVTERGLDRIVRSEVELKKTQQRDLLRRLKYPDFDRLVGLVAADLRTKESQGFGEFSIHRSLTVDQLRELAGLVPELENQLSFVQTRIAKMQPGADEDRFRDPAVQQAYLDRVWEYVSTLPPAFSDFKASVLKERLSFALLQGEFPKDEFMEYLALPRSMPYMNPEYLRAKQRQGVQVLSSPERLQSVGLQAFGNDESLVRAYLEHFFRTEKTYVPYTNFVKEDYVKQVFAETKLIYGIGDSQQWFSLLSPSEVQRIQDRIEIKFSHTNPEVFAVNDAVDLTADIKNVKELIVKVYELNTLNFYQSEKREINTDLDLDGLVANEETIVRYEQPGIRRHRETFTFPSMANRRGVWVVELIGNGISSRALIRKGKLEYLSRHSAGGALVTVINENNELAEEASVWLGGKEYKPGEGGSILLPFSQTGSNSIVLSSGDFHSFASIELPTERYQFDAGVFLEQETLLPGLEASVLVKPTLSLHGEPISLEAIESGKISITTTDLDGVTSVNESSDVEFFNNRETVSSFRVPNRLQSVSVEVSGEIPPVSGSREPIEISAVRSFHVNGIDTQATTFDSYLSREEDQWFLEVLGKSGEPIDEQAVSLEFKHESFSMSLRTSCKTDPEGRVALGSLPGIERVALSGNGLQSRSWDLDQEKDYHLRTIHAREGAPIVIPDSGSDAALSRNEFALFELRKETPVADLFGKAKRIDGGIEIADLAPGNYEAVLKQSGRSLSLKVTKADAVISGWALSANRHLELPRAGATRLASVEADDEEITINVAGAFDFGRVHLVATRYLPEFDLFSSLRSGSSASPFLITRGENESQYISGRDIGEEYRYILERRNAERFPGNMLSRPGLILNPWELSETNTDVDDAEKGDAYRKSSEMKRSSRAPGAPEAEALERERRSAPSNTTPSFQFAGQQALTIFNLKIEEDGTVKVPRENLEDRHFVHVLVTTPFHSSYRSVALTEPENGFTKRDLRLEKALDPEKNYTQRQNVTFLDTGASLKIDDLRATEFETYDTVAGIYGALSSLAPEAKFSEFSFVSRWNTLGAAEKRAFYSEFACHELNFFLSRKDEDFFKTVIQSYLRNKKDKTFLDHYLIESPLEKFLQPWEFSRLNIVERILLSRRIGEEEAARTARHVRSLHELLPPNPGMESFGFRQALRGRNSERFAGSKREMQANAALGFADVAPVVVAAPMAADGFSAGAVVNEASADPFSAPAPAMGGGGLAASGRISLQKARELAETQALYRKLESTREWAENNYYELPIEQQLADLVGVNAFWRDFAIWDGKGGFYSREFPLATGNFTEKMFALSVLDLPFEAENHEFTINESSLTITAKTPLVVFHEEVKETGVSEEKSPILVSQNFFRNDDRNQFIDGQQVDKFVTDEFLTGVVYGSQIVVTNPTSSSYRLDLLTQIPEGAIPVNRSSYTKSEPIQLAPFSTEKEEVFFYFPSASGEDPFAVYPVRVSKNEEVIAKGADMSFRVVDKLSRFDEASWEYLSQYGSEKEVFDYLSVNNLERIDLSLIAWRCKESVDFFRQVTDLLAENHAYDSQVWSYAVFHNVSSAAGEFLKHQDRFLSECGLWLESDLVTLEPVERHWYQHLEYSPLVNARSHQLGRERTILNDRFRAQYGDFIELAGYKTILTDEDELAVSGYLFLQDRIGEGLQWLEKVDPDNISTILQYDYLKSYAALYQKNVDEAGAIAAKYLEFPVDRWREKFAEVDSQVREIKGLQVEKEGDLNREDQLERLSKKDAIIDLTVNGREIEVAHRGVEDLTVNYYEMDLEFLFSSKPFVSGGSGQFSIVRPNVSVKQKVPDGDSFVLTLPEKFESKNVLVEVSGGGKTDSVAVYSNQLKVRIAENYGRVDVLKDSGEALSGAYVKVYARMKGGDVRFFKDGYTDLRGRLDYTSLSTDEIERVEKLSVLIMSDDHGSLVREVSPPQM